MKEENTESTDDDLGENDADSVVQKTPSKFSTAQGERTDQDGEDEVDAKKTDDAEKTEDEDEEDKTVKSKPQSEDAPCDSAAELEKNNKKADDLIKKFEERREENEEQEIKKTKSIGAKATKKANRSLSHIASGVKELHSSKKMKKKTAKKNENNDNNEASKETADRVKVEKQADKDLKLISDARLRQKKIRLGKHLTEDEKKAAAADEDRDEERGTDADEAAASKLEEKAGDSNEVLKEKPEDDMPSLTRKAPVVHAKIQKVKKEKKAKQVTDEAPCDSAEDMEKANAEADDKIKDEEEYRQKVESLDKEKTERLNNVAK